MAKSLKQKKAENMVYGLGAAVVILGALFKLTHWELGPKWHSALGCRTFY